MRLKYLGKRLDWNNKLIDFYQCEECGRQEHHPPKDKKCIQCKEKVEQEQLSFD